MNRRATPFVYKIVIKNLGIMKKILIASMATVALLLGGASSAFAEEPCCNSSCQAKEGFETIGEGAKQAATNSYEVVKEGTVNTYEKAKGGVETGYEKTKEGVTEGYEVVKEGSTKTYEKAKKGVVNLWNSAKEKIHKATE